MATPACKEEISKEWLQVILTQYESRSKPKASVSVTHFEVNPGELQLPLLSSCKIKKKKRKTSNVSITKNNSNICKSFKVSIFLYCSYARTHKYIHARTSMNSHTRIYVYL